MPKGRGSNKKGGGPTPPKQRPQAPPQPSGMAVELMVTKNQLEEAVVAKRQLQGQVQQLMRLLVLVLSRRRDNRVKITPSQAESAMERFSGVSMDEDDDGNLTLELVEQTEVEDVTSES